MNTDSVIADYLDEVVRLDGPKAASWIVRQYKRSFHERGFVDYICEADKLPTWFSVAMKYFDKYAPGWNVVRTPTTGSVHYRLQWLNRGKYAR